ncbi:hypothetical protein CKO28_19130 [Rhodovibrio sodomensis]|uniref:Glycosyltransferase family 4 protein n=2 Tax=Rhodovibrio sodomensis TaxID=1088 RepID=A0ABS1DIN8_9PROT|nr:hypothetical protein [Rhodovibrio sodomensis]
MLRTLTVTSLFPNRAQPRHGIFTEHRLKHLVSTKRVETDIVAPLPWAPKLLARTKRYGIYTHVPRCERRDPFSVRYLRYLTIPLFGMTLSPLTMAASLYLYIRRNIKTGHFDVIDSYYIFPDGVASAIVARLLRKPYVLTGYGTDINLIPDYALPRRMILWACKHAAAITVVCQALKDQLVRIGVDESKIKVVLHGVDLERFQPPSSRKETQKTIGIKRPTLLSVGHLIERKGHHIVLEAMTTLPEFDLLVIGDGEMEDALKEQAQRLGVDARVRFLGHISQEKLPAYFQAADALVLASSREGIANVLLESMACGTPVVATDVWGSKELVTSDVCGRLAPDRTAASIAQSVRDLFENYPERTHVRAHAEHYRWENTAKTHAEILENVLHHYISLNRDRYSAL